MRRADVVQRLTEILGDRVWAWQGATAAVQQWQAASDAKDLDIWCHDGHAEAVRSAVSQGLPAARIEHADDPRRLRHTGWAVFTDDGPAVVDITFGDLRVGPVLLCRQGDITSADCRLTGGAAAADLLVRPVLRGRLPDADRLDEARTAWSACSETLARDVHQTWREGLGPLADELVAVLRGAGPAADLPGRARRMLLRQTVRPRNLPAAWQQRRSILPTGRRGPLGHRIEGVVVALVGTDGSGKSTVAGTVAQRLEDLGLTTSSAYFGMARGNLPGVGLARKVLGVPESGGEQVDSDAQPQGPPTDQAMVRRLAAWYYAVEYGWRYLSTVAGPRRRGNVVICDRYVYDLRESPWPGSRAAAFAEWLVPRPDLLVLPDAPAELIHARKPERSLAEQAAQQQALRELLAQGPARCGNLTVDTSGATDHPEDVVVRAVYSAAHLGR